ncbi:TetR/AcrR family transcriptional regulator [Glycomyces halotolerans]
MSSNTSGGTTRRERMRAETIGEIKASAHRQLAEHGPSGISLRAIARDVGVSPAALYRYFDSLDALLTELCCDFYDELIATAGAAMDEFAPDDHLNRMKAWVWSFRSWVVSHRSEFELMLNVPEGQSAMAMHGQSADVPFEELPPVVRKSMEHAQMCGHELAGYYKQTDGEGFDFSSVPMPELSEGLRDELRYRCAAMIIGEDLPLSWVFAFISGWVRIFGLVTMEAFGSLPVQQNIDEFYKSQIKSMMHDFGLGDG